MMRFIRDLAEGIKTSLAIFLLIACVASYVFAAVAVLLALAGESGWRDPVVLVAIGIVSGALCYVVTETL